ncbi:MAG TPA: quinolinate synthase NadA [Dehalococcoidales bacterium]|nr:quinolinate synthase NadA [Dehalococcoidales bacterium]
MAEKTIEEQIKNLKKKRNAVIMAHNYQRAEVQDIADFVGDSLELSQKAAQTKAEVIIFCGVHFMAETASILNPKRKVILPDANAGCPMANMITADQLRQKKAEMPDVTVVTYINSTAAVKAESDYCCTSANGVKVVSSIKSDNILFVPDQYLGDFISKRTGKKMTLWPGYCPTHMRILPEDILKRRQEHPNAKVVVHPECRPDAIAAADEALSTSGMVRYSARPDVQELIVGTEIELLHRLYKENPHKKFYPVSDKVVCPNMKLITIEKVLSSLETLGPEVKVPEDIRIKALAAVERMLELP